MAVGEQLKLKEGTPAQINQASYSAGTLYLSRKDTTTADLFFDVGGTRLRLQGIDNLSYLSPEKGEAMADLITLQYRANPLNDDEAEDMIDDIWDPPAANEDDGENTEGE